jgi:hypothetical protein
LIIGSELEIQSSNYMSRIRPQSVFGSLDAWEVRFDIPIVFRPSPELAARTVEKWTYYFCREHIKAGNELLRAAQNAEPEGEQ